MVDLISTKGELFLAGNGSGKFLWCIKTRIIEALSIKEKKFAFAGIAIVFYLYILF